VADFLEGAREKFELLVALVIELGVSIDLFKAKLETFAVDKGKLVEEE
jgi:hypothetical protein